MKKRFSCLAVLNTAGCVTLAGFLCGLSTALSFFAGRMRLFYLSILSAVLIDACDGYIARKLHQESPTGAMLDSMSDVCGFVALPALVFCKFGHFAPLYCVSAVVYAVCGLLRLVDFTERAPDARFFSGLASPWAASLLLSVNAILFHLLKFEPEGILAILPPVFCALLGVGMISGGIRFRKFGPSCAAVAVVGLTSVVWGLIAG